MKYWLSQVPSNVWMDVLRHPWIERKQLGSNVERFRNRKYAEYLQFFLHDWGERTLEPLDFQKEGVRRHLPPPNFWPLQRTPKPAALPIPLTPVPANIKCFEYIQISHFDRHTIDFLRQIQPLLAAINLDIQGIPEDLAHLRHVLATLLPLTNGTHSLCCNVCALPMVGQLFGAGGLAKVKTLKLDRGHLPKPQQQATIRSIMDWLTTKQQQQPADGIGAKQCDVELGNDNGFSAQISTAIRQDFLVAKKPRTFAVILHPPYQQKLQFAEFHLTNGIGEQLHGEWVGEEIRITRYRANCAKQLQEWIEENEAMRSSGHSKICVQTPTIGPFGALEEEEAQKPSTSKKGAKKAKKGAKKA